MVNPFESMLDELRQRQLDRQDDAYNDAVSLGILRRSLPCMKQVLPMI